MSVHRVCSSRHEPEFCNHYLWVLAGPDLLQAGPLFRKNVRATNI